MKKKDIDAVYEENPAEDATAEEKASGKKKKSKKKKIKTEPVSYTHLTLPTILLV